MAEKKPSHQIRINNSMIHDIKNSKNPNLKAVTVGLEAADGTSTKGNLLIGKSTIVPDKNTATLAARQQKSYVNFVRDNDYSIKLGGADKAIKMSGADIVDQNHAYMKTLNKSRTAQLESAAEKDSPEAEASVEQPEA